jgi:hypothetical protein
MFPENIKKYTFGEPYDTGAVVIGIDGSYEACQIQGL